MFRMTERWSQSAQVCARESMGGIMLSVRRDKTFREWLLRKRVPERISWWRAGDGRWFHYPSFELIDDASLIRQLERMIGNDWIELGGPALIHEVIP